MSCENCEKKQDLAFNKNIAESTPIAYIRVGNANVAIVACDKHAKEVVEKLNK